LFTLTESLENQNKLHEEPFHRVESYLKKAAQNYKNDGSEWGLGLTYNLLGRIYSIREKDEESFSSAK
jgi:hypothetical protein